MQSNNTLHSSKPTGMDSKNSTYAPNTSNPALPFWDNNEINKRLDEHAKLLIEWEELLNRTGGPEVTSISQQDATRHIVLKRKLHESLGVMARIVQNQLKMKKTPSDSAPSNTAPVMVSTAPAQNAYAQNQHQNNHHNQHPTQGQGQGQGAAHNNGMLLPSTGYQQGMDYAAANNNSGNNNNNSNSQMHAQSMPMQYSNGGYNYQNNYVPTAQPGMAQPGQYYNYNSTAVPGQVQGQQMYVPQYQMNTSLPNTNMGTMNTTLNPSTAMNTNMTGNTTNGVYGVAYTAYPAASYIPQHANPAQAYTYNTSGAVYPGTDGASLLYSQQMLQQVPTSYYGNSSVANGGGVAGAGTTANTTTNTNPITNTTGTANVQQAPGQVQQNSTTHSTTHSSGYQSAPNLQQQQQQQQQQQYHGLPSQHSQQSLPTTLPSTTANSNNTAHASTTHANTAHASSHAAHPVHTLPAHAAHTNYSVYSGDGQINAVMSMNPGMYNGAIISNVNNTSGGNANTNTGGSQQ